MHDRIERWPLLWYRIRNDNVPPYHSMLNFFVRLSRKLSLWRIFKFDLLYFDQWFLSRKVCIEVILICIWNPMHNLFRSLLLPRSALRVRACRPRIWINVLKTQEGWSPFVNMWWVLIRNKFFYISLVLSLNFQHLVHHLWITLLGYFFVGRNVRRQPVIWLRRPCFSDCSRALLCFIFLRPISQKLDELIDLQRILIVIVFDFHILVL